MLTELPPRVVFVDPGTTKGHGHALFWDAQMKSAELIEADVLPRYTTDSAQHAVVEMPCEAFGGTVHTIINLARAAERAVAAYTIRGEVTYIHPSGTHAWKRGSKVQHQYNAWHALSPAEAQRVANVGAERKWRSANSPETILATLQERCQREARGTKLGEWLMGNVLDAVYMGLWAYGRIDEFGRY